MPDAEAVIVDHAALDRVRRKADWLHVCGAIVSGHAVGRAPVVIPAPATAEVDPTGAGDTFAAAFVTATRAGADPVSASRATCAIAARSVGAMELALGPADLRPDRATERP